MNYRLFVISLTCLLLLMAPGCIKEYTTDDGAILSGKDKLKQVQLYGSVDSDLPIAIIEEYEYDDNGRISRVSSPMYNEGRITGTTWYELYEYNNAGRLTGKRNFNANLNAPSGFINLKNYSYEYSPDGNKEKELIEYPLAGLSEYTLYTYYHGKPVRAEKFDNRENLESYTTYSYDHSGKLITEHFYSSDDLLMSFTVHTWYNGLQIRSDEYSVWGNRRTHLRELIRQYDNDNNLTTLESNELSMFSSRASYVFKYEYY